jgi:hypothetical protein
MTEYEIAFTGRKKGAIGIFYPIVARRTAENPDAAVLALYDEYEHIHMPKVREVSHVR